MVKGLFKSLTSSMSNTNSDTLLSNITNYSSRNIKAHRPWWFSLYGLLAHLWPSNVTIGFPAWPLLIRVRQPGMYVIMPAGILMKFCSTITSRCLTHMGAQTDKITQPTQEQNNQARGKRPIRMFVGCVLLSHVCTERTMPCSWGLR